MTIEIRSDQFQAGKPITPELRRHIQRMAREAGITTVEAEERMGRFFRETQIQLCSGEICRRPII